MPVTMEESTVPGGVRRGPVELRRLGEDEPPRRVGGLDRGHGEASRAEDEDEGGGPEEPGDVRCRPPRTTPTPTMTATSTPAPAPDGPEERSARLGADEGEDEHRDLEALSKDGEEGHGGQGPGPSSLARRPAAVGTGSTIRSFGNRRIQMTM